MIVPDSNSKVPVVIRQRYLNTIINECLKICGGDELEAFERAELEEAECCSRATSRTLYLNIVVNCIKKLRLEAAEVSKSGGNKKRVEQSAPDASGEAGVYMGLSRHRQTPPSKAPAGKTCNPLAIILPLCAAQ